MYHEKNTNYDKGMHAFTPYSPKYWWELNLVVESIINMLLARFKFDGW